MTKEIKLQHGMVAIIDDSDYAAVTKITWTAMKHRKRYRVISVPKKGESPTYLHRLIVGARDRESVDHINGDGLDNRRANLRICTPSQNSMNRNKQSNNKSGYKGVRKMGNGWQAKIGVCRKVICIGTFSTPEAAAHAYDDAARKYHGAFAKTNF